MRGARRSGEHGLRKIHGGRKLKSTPKEISSNQIAGD
jgi:hypothetical protein